MFLKNSKKIKRLEQLSAIDKDPNNQWRNLSISIDDFSFGYLITLEIYNSDLDVGITRHATVRYTGFMSKWFMMDNDEKRVDRVLKGLTKKLMSIMKNENEVLRLREKYKKFIL